MSGKETQYTLVERYQVNRLKHLLDCMDLTKENEKVWHRELERYMKALKKGTISVKYDYTVKIKEKRYGRMYPRSKGVSSKKSGTIPCYLNLESTLRDFLLAETDYTIIDISNCHATLVQGLLDYYKIECPNLVEYNKNRKAILEKYGCEKELIGKCLNYEGFEAYQFKNPEDREFFLEIRRCIFDGLYPCLKAEDRFKDLFDYTLVNKEKEEGYNSKNSFVSLAYQTIESTFVKFAMEYFSEPALGLSVDALFHDGLLIGGLDMTVLTQDKWNEEINARFNKYFPYSVNLKFTPKTFAINEQLQKIYNRKSDEEARAVEQTKEIYTDREVAEHIFNKLLDQGHLFKYNGDVWIYDPNSYLWKKDAMKEIVRSLLGQCDLPVKGGLVKDCTKFWCHYIVQIDTLCFGLSSDEKKGLSLDAVKDIIPYENGYYDFKSSKFIHHTQTSNSHLNYFTMCCTRNYSGEVDPDVFSRVRSLFLDVFDGDEEAMSEVLSFYMRALTGHVEDKVFLTECGLRNSGKGFKVDALLAAFPGLASTFSPTELYSNNTYDADRRMGFAIEFTSKRLMLGSEIPSSVVLDGTLIKSLASGGDRLSGRQAYGKTKTGTVKALFCLSCQLLPDCKPANALQNMLSFDMPCKFYTPTELEELKNSNTGCLAIAKLADPNIKNESKTDEFINALTKLLFGYYSSKKPAYKILSKGTAELMENSESVFDTRVYFDLVFEKNFVRDPNSKVNIVSFHNAFKNDKFDIETSARTVSKYFKTNHKLEQIKSNGIKYYKGIKPLSDVSEFEERD